MKILLRLNPKKSASTACALQIINKLHELDITPMLDIAVKKYIEAPFCEFGDYDDLARRCDMIMPVGGDGTMMRSAQSALLADKPIIGVNAGRIGFLTQLESCELERLALLKAGKFSISQRMMLEGTVSIAGKSSKTFTALNDIVVSSGENAGIVDVQVSTGGKVIATQRCDGIIFATPTGSTAYSLSAGGPVVDPELELMVLTAVCPHATYRYSLVLPMDREYSAHEIIVNRVSGLTITADGRRIEAITANDGLTIRKHEASVKFIDLGIHDFYKSLGEKLRWS